MIQWLCEVFGFAVHILVDDDQGGEAHSEPLFGGGILMVAQADKGAPERWNLHRASPMDVGGANTQTLQLYVDDVDEHYKRARQGGATIVQEPFLADHGADYWADKSYGCLDPEGHLWWITERVRG